MLSLHAQDVHVELARGLGMDIGPGGRWVVVKDIKADPGGCMAIIESDVYRSTCMVHNPGIPVYSRNEIDIIKSHSGSAETFRAVQKIKRVFKNSRVIG